jgi:hypothetical protein
MADKPRLVDQPDWRPSRKLFMSAVTGFLTLGVQSTVAKIAAGSVWFDWLGNEIALGAIPIMVGFGVGYVMRDRATPAPQPEE